MTVDEVGGSWRFNMCARQAHIGIGFDCAHLWAQTQSEDHPPTANANQVPNKKRAQNRQFQARHQKSLGRSSRLVTSWSIVGRTRRWSRVERVVTADTRQMPLVGDVV